MKNYLLSMLVVLTCFACVNDKESSYVTDLRKSKAEWLKAEAAFMAAQTEVELVQKLINEATLAAKNAANAEAAARWEMELKELAIRHENTLLEYETQFIYAKTALAEAKAEAELKKDETVLKYIQAYETKLENVRDTQGDINDAVKELTEANDKRENKIKRKKEKLEQKKENLVLKQKELDIYTELQAAGDAADAIVEAKIAEVKVAIDSVNKKISMQNLKEAEIYNELHKDYEQDLFQGISSDFYFPYAVSVTDFIAGSTCNGLVDTSSVLIKGIRTFVAAEKVFGKVFFDEDDSENKVEAIFQNYKYSVDADVDMHELKDMINSLENFDINDAKRELVKEESTVKSLNKSIDTLRPNADKASVAYAKAKDAYKIAKDAYDKAVAGGKDDAIEKAQKTLDEKATAMYDAESKYEDLKSKLENALSSLDASTDNIEVLKDDIESYDKKLAIAKELKTTVEAGKYKKLLDARDLVLESYFDIYTETENLRDYLMHYEELLINLEDAKVDYASEIDNTNETIEEIQEDIESTKAYIAKLEASEPGTDMQISIDYYTARIEILKQRLSVEQAEADRLKELIANTESV
ncbi:MAG: hypothetical protein ACK5L5_02655 [Bacteroidales bacterium]